MITVSTEHEKIVLRYALSTASVKRSEEAWEVHCKLTGDTLKDAAASREEAHLVRQSDELNDMKNGIKVVPGFDPSHSS